MSNKWDGEPCPVCLQGILHDAVRPEEFIYRGYILQYKQQGAYCDHCNDGVLSGDEASAMDPVFLQFRETVDKKIAAELVRIRKKLKLTQQQAALLTGGGKNAFSRYERGEAKPIDAVHNLFLLLDKHPALLKEIQVSKMAFGSRRNIACKKHTSRKKTMLRKAV